MAAGVALQQKLLQLRMLPGPAPQAERLTAPVDKKPGHLKSSPDEDRLELSEESSLRKKILEARGERDVAIRRRHKIEKDSCSQHSHVARDIAKYHCLLHALQNNITANKEEVNVLRQTCHKADLKKESQQLRARKLKEEAELCKAQKAKLVVDVNTASERVAALQAEVKTFQQHLEEVLERKVVEEAEIMAASLSRAAEEEDPNKSFSMSTGSDDEDEEEEDNEKDDTVLMTDLELSCVMPLPQLARLATGHIAHQETMSKVNIPESGFLEREGLEFSRWTRPSPSGNKEWKEEELEAEYGDHLRNLEGVLLELRQEEAEQAEERRCRPLLAALQRKKRKEAAAAAAAAANRFPWSIQHRMRRQKSETPTPKVSVVSGFSHFSPYAVMCRKYAALAVCSSFPGMEPAQNAHPSAKNQKTLEFKFASCPTT